MKISNQASQQYYPDLTRSRYSSRTSRKLKLSRHSQWQNDAKTKFQKRIENACTTTSNKDLLKQINLCRKEIQRLQKDHLKKDKLILEIKSGSNINKELEAQLVQTYRIIYMYEGKINQYEKQLKRLEEFISQKLPKDITNKVQELLQSYRVDNGELQASLQQRNRQIWQMQKKIKSTQNKYFNATWKLSSTKRQISNPLKQKFPNLRNTIVISQAPLLEKEKAMLKRSPSPVIVRQENQKVTQVIEKPKEFLKLRTVQTKQQRPQVMIVTPSQKRFSLGNERIRTQIKQNPIQKIRTEYGKFQVKEVSRQPSPSTQRKVYSSAINRFQINRSSNQNMHSSMLNANQRSTTLLGNNTVTVGGVYTTKYQPKRYSGQQQYVYF